MHEPIQHIALNVLFQTARTHNAWLDKPISDEALRELYDSAKWGPTSANSSPMRIVFLRTPASKERLKPFLAPPNVDKTMGAPVTAIIAYDLKFYEKLPQLFPHYPMRDYFALTPGLPLATAERNGSMQGGYFILAARALGLDCGPMSGFDNASVDQEFFSPAAREKNGGKDLFPEGDIRSNFLCNLGYGDTTKLFPRSPRLEFSDACSLL